MKSPRTSTAALSAAAAAAVVVSGASGAKTTAPPLFTNCTHLNAKYRHRIGKVGAHNHTSGVPVTNVLRSKRLYALAMKYNHDLDRGKDGIACEKA